MCKLETHKSDRVTLGQNSPVATSYHNKNKTQAPNLGSKFLTFKALLDPASPPSPSRLQGTTQALSVLQHTSLLPAPGNLHLLFSLHCLLFLQLFIWMTPSLSVQFSSVTQSCPTLCDPMNRSTPGLPVHHHLPEFTQTHVHRVRDAIQPSHSWSSLSPTAPNLSQHQSLFQ